MSKLTRILFKFLDLMVIFVMAFGSPISALAEASPTGATITTQLPDYPPGSVVLMTGAGWFPDESVHIIVSADDQSWILESNPDPVADSLGAFTYEFTIANWFIPSYTVTATGFASGTATVSFTDLNIGTYDQCSNDVGTGYTSGDTGCRWINGNLQGNNSYYAEGDATVQRLWMTDLVPGSTHTIAFDYGTTKGGKHSYDFLTTWNWSENWITVADRCQGITGCTTAGEMAFDIPNDPNVPDTFEPNMPGSRQFVIRGGTLTGAAFATPIPFTGSYAGDSDTRIQITFTTASSGNMCTTKQGVTTCGIALWFGAHVATQANWGFGLGAGSISGSPYHVSLAQLDGASIGSRDNQMQASAVTVIPNGTIVIVKDAVPNDAQDFSFNLQNNPLTISQDFKLDDDSDSTLPNSQTFSVPPGTWYGKELMPLPAGWSLTKIVCVDPTNNTTVDLATAIAGINLASNETVTCTYTNSRYSGSLKLSKSLTGGPAGYTGPFTIHYDCGVGYTGDVSVAAGSSQTVSGIPSGTSCTISEPTLPSPPGEYTFGTPNFSPSAAVTIGAGTTVEVITNNTLTRNTGSLKLTKSLTGGPAFYAGPFTIHYDCGVGYTGDVSVEAGGSQMVSGISSGTSCTISEPTLPIPPAGYTFGTPTFSPSATITIGTGTAVEVTTNNTLTLDTGSLKISKTLSNPDGASVPASFIINYDCGIGYTGSVTVAAGSSKIVSGIPTGSTCSVSEPTLTPIPGYTWGTPVVTGSPATIAKNTTVEVSVANSITRDLGSLELAKSLTGGPGNYTGPFTVNYDCGVGFTGSVSVAAGSSQTVSGIPTGTSCSVSETLPTPPTGYSFGTPTFSPSATVTIPAGNGSSVTVTTNNTLTRDTGSLTIAKTLNNPDGASVPSSFTINYDCGAGYTGSVTVAAGGSQTVSGIPTGSTCAVSEPTLAPIPGYTWGTPTFTPSSIVISSQGGTFEIVVGNSITRDTGSLKLSKTLIGGPQNYAGPFTINYDCGGTYTGSVSVYAGSSQTVAGIPTGSFCKISEILPIPPTGYAFGTPTFSPSDTVTIDTKDATVEITTTNKMGQDLIVTKTASGTFGRTYLWDISKAADKTSVNIANGGTATFNYTVNVAQTGISDAGWTMSGKITLTNPNDWEDITLTSLNDVVDNGGTCTVDPGPYVVPKSGSLDVNYSCSYASAPSSYSGKNTATATWDKDAYFTPSSSASGSADFTLNQLGSTNKTVHVTDSYGGDLGTVTATDSAPFATASFTYSKDLEGVGGKCTKYDNTATITETDQSASKTVEVCVGLDLTVSKTATGTFDRTYLWKISKDVDKTSVNIAIGGLATFNYTVDVEQTGISDSGWTLSGVITISNPNDWEDITLTSLSDVVDNGGTCTVAVGPYVVPKSGSLDVAYSCTYDSASALSGTNTATATWDKAAAFTPTGSASGDKAFTLSQVGKTNQTVHVTDSLGGALGTVTATDAAPFAKATFTYSHDFAGVGGTCTKYDNTATITETMLSAEKSVEVCVGLDLTVSKTATPSFTRTWDWIITKDFDATYNLFAGQSVTHGYKVTVMPTSTDSAWKIVGVITITNPNDWEDIMLTDLSDVADGGACTVDLTLPIVPKGGSVDINYTCTWAAQPSSYSGTNIATATWDKATAFTPNGSANGSKNYEFTNPTEINPVITVEDDNLTGEEWSANRAYVEWTYTKEFACSANPADYKNGKYSYDLTNTAQINETGQTDTATVDINCYAPKVVKNATAYWNRDWDWNIVKDYNGSYNLFAGDTVTHSYKVTVTPTHTDNFWGVKGTITVYNYHPTEAMTLTGLTDLAGGINGNVTCESLVIPANSSLTCTYDTGTQDKPNANPFGNLNTATAAFAGADWTGTYPIVFSAAPTTEDEPVITVDDNNLTGENWSADRAKGEWTYTKNFACSTDGSMYTNGKYSYSLTNTAKINETGQTDTATVDVTCYWPQIELTKTGDTLSKIGDGVTYTIKLDNNTPADAGLRALSCTINDPIIGFNKTVTLASGASDTSTKVFTIPAGASDPFLNTASVTCKPVAATAPVVGSSTFSVSDSDDHSTNLFQPAVEIIKTGPLYATSGDVINYTFTISNKSSSDSPNLMLDSVNDNVLGDLKAAAMAAGCDNLVYNGSCTFTANYTVPEVGLQPYKKTNVVTVHYHPAGFPNDITDTDDHTVTLVPRSQLTDTSFCPLPNNQFRLLYHLEVAPNIYRLQASNPGQWYMNSFYYGTPGSDFVMTIQIPYPFMTQEGAGVPIQVHDGTALTSSGCYLPSPTLSGFTITTPAMTPTSSAGNQIITPEDYTTKNLGSTTTVMVSGKVPATGIAYVTIHLDYGLKKTGGWKQTGTYTTNPVNGASVADILNQTGFGSGPVTIHGYEVYNFARTVGSDTSTTQPSSYNEFKKFAGFMGFVTSKSTGNPVKNTSVVIYSPLGKVLATVYTDADGYYMYPYKHTAKSATYKVALQAFGLSFSVTVKANGLAAIDFEVP